MGRWWPPGSRGPSWPLFAGGRLYRVGVAADHERTKPRDLQCRGGGCPVAFVFSFFVLELVGYAFVAAWRAASGGALPGYLLEEGGIAIAVVVWLAIGVWLLIGLSLRGAEPRARVR